MKQCPIQIIEIDGNHNMWRAGARWIALAKDIVHEERRYKNICPYHSNLFFVPTKLDKNFFKMLFHGETCVEISRYDIIRNPTMEELIEISNAAKHLGIKINLKTMSYIGNL